MIRKVHVVFKTHLDIGFTDFSDQVVQHYLYKYIPAAIRVAREVNRQGEPPRFVWTVGSYLIDLALRALDQEAAGQLDQAIRQGYVAYHAMPFTTHSELCSPELFDAGLNIARRLDRRFGRKTIAAKMSDVPGHTAGIIAPLLSHGVTFLHLGINAVSMMPKVPSLFLWENAAGQRLMVNYTRTYGGLTTIDGHDEALVFLHTDDNAGPPAAAFLQQAFEGLQKQFPDAQIFASTLDAFAGGLMPLADRLPVIRGEIGDTWIHGVGCDPKKTGELRALERLCRSWDEAGAWEGLTALPGGQTPREAFLEQLLLVAEHTWGLDTKKFLTDFSNWSRADFELARRQDKLRDEYGLGVGYNNCFHFARREFERLKPQGIAWEDRSYSLFEASHQEQRSYVKRAVAQLPESLRVQAEAALGGIPVLPAGEERGLEASAGPFALRLEEGEVHVSLGDRPLLSIHLPIYQEVGLDAYGRLVNRYLTDVESNRDWAVPDNCKPGAEHSDAPKEDRIHTPQVRNVTGWDEAWQLEGEYQREPHDLAGCPQAFSLRFSLEQGSLMVTVALRQKPANRKPEALFLPIRVKESGDVSLQKIGEWVDPAACTAGGNRRTHGVQAIRFYGDGQPLEVIPLDTPLVCLGGPKLLDFDGDAWNGQVFSCLYNNLWGTNFKMWYDEDIIARFLIRLGKEA